MYLISSGISPLVSCVVAQLHFVSDTLTWDDAQSYCRTNYTDLVTINKEEENQSLLNISGKQEFWIGLKRYNDNWQWSNKDEVTYSKWKRDFFCAFIQSDGSWNDTVCFENLPFMCYKANKILRHTL
uniref:C-type lectin domain-containing protein n=1 Tax=Erpetoichthys calabaricus TaxID=27687 RepID=A0A8C4RU37_ERPCA